MFTTLEVRGGHLTAILAKHFDNDVRSVSSVDFKFGQDGAVTAFVNCIEREPDEIADEDKTAAKMAGPQSIQESTPESPPQTPPSS